MRSELRLANQYEGRGRQQGTEDGGADVSAGARGAKADVAQLAERVLGKDEVTSSILVIGSNLAAYEQRSPAPGCGGVRQNLRRDSKTREVR